MATLTIDGHFVPMTEQNVTDSQIVSDMVDDGDTEVPLMIGTHQQAIRAVEAITVLRKFGDVVEKFNHPDKGTTTQQLVALKTEIADHYEKLQTLILDNEVYHWLYPINELVRVVCDYEHAKSVAGWYKDKDIPDDYDKDFRWACINRHLSIAKWLYSLGDVDIHTDVCYGIDSFRWACEKGNQDIAKWLYSLGGVDIHAENDYAFRWTCRYGHESIAKWLYGLGGVDIHARENDAYLVACQNGHKSIVKWLKTLD
jgi:hypothetical protein